MITTTNCCQMSTVICATVPFWLQEGQSFMKQCLVPQRCFFVTGQWHSRGLFRESFVHLLVTFRVHVCLIATHLPQINQMYLKSLYILFFSEDAVMDSQVLGFLREIVTLISNHTTKIFKAFQFSTSSSYRKKNMSIYYIVFESVR